MLVQNRKLCDCLRHAESSKLRPVAGIKTSNSRPSLFLGQVALGQKTYFHQPASATHFKDTAID